MRFSWAICWLPSRLWPVAVVKASSTLLDESTVSSADCKAELDGWREIEVNRLVGKFNTKDKFTSAPWESSMIGSEAPVPARNPTVPMEITACSAPSVSVLLSPTEKLLENVRL